jgi:hypothetical protein
MVDDGRPVVPTPAPGWTPTFVPPTPPASPGRGFAIAAFVVALGSVVTGWVPFLFVFAVVGAISAVVFALIALRRSKHGDGRGRRFAIVALVLAPVALGLCVIGWQLTRAVVDEVGEFVDPGEYDLVEDVPCTIDDRVATFTGTVTNLEVEPRSYTINVEFLDTSSPGSPRVIARDGVTVGQVAAGETASWEAVRLIGNAENVACEVTEVFGPLPFGDR